MFFPRHIRFFVKLTNSPLTKYCFSTVNFDSLALKYQKEQSFNIFKQSLPSSLKLTHSQNENCFQVYKILESNPFHYQSYCQFVFLLQPLTNKSDNLLIMQSKLLLKLAKHFQCKRDFATASTFTDRGLQVLQSAKVPPILPYYQLYLYTGVLAFISGHSQQAFQILKQSYETIDAFVGSSGQRKYFTKEQRSVRLRALQLLSLLDSTQSQRYLSEAESIWQEVGDEKYANSYYTEFVLSNVQRLLLKAESSPPSEQETIKLSAVLYATKEKNRLSAETKEQLEHILQQYK